jgi:hypothetical protein
MLSIRYIGGIESTLTTFIVIVSTMFSILTLYSKVKSRNGNVCAQVYTNGRYMRVFPMTSKSSENIAHTK